MSRYRFELATEADDADLRHVLAATPTPGRVAVTFRREPSWFAGAVVDGRFRQVVVCRDRETGRVIGFGCRSVRELSVNGVPQQVGYLSSLRVLPENRNRGLVARGYAFFRRLHQDGRVKYYLTTIAEGNETALRVLTSGRAGLPAYHPAGEYRTVAVPLPRQPQAPPSCRDLRVREAQPDDLPAILAFLAEVGPQRQFFPVLRADDFESPGGLMRGLGVTGLLLAERGGRLVGTLAGWDQHADRQCTVLGYHGCLRAARPLYNVWARVCRLPGLPPPGASLRYLMGALPVVAGDDVTVFAALVETLRARAAGGPWTHLMLGLHDRDPLSAVAQRFRAACYSTRLFLVCWPDGDGVRTAVDDRAPYLEAGSL